MASAVNGISICSIRRLTPSTTSSPLSAEGNGLRLRIRFVWTHRGRCHIRDSPTLAKFPAHRAGGRHASSDERLVESVAAGDRLAMEILYARHHVRVYRFVLRLVSDAAAAENLTSEVFLDIWRNVSRFEGRSQVSTWMLSIARHKALDALRCRVDEQLDDEIVSEIPDGALPTRGRSSRPRRRNAAAASACPCEITFCEQLRATVV